MKNHFEVRGAVTAIFLNSRKYGEIEALISTEKLDKVDDFKGWWYPQNGGGSIYVYGCIPGKKDKKFLLHRFITGAPSKMVVDHINHDTLDNTNENLRIVTNAENMQNRIVVLNKTSGVLGITYHKRAKKWQAQVKVGGKNHYVGLFEELSEAKIAITQARKEWMPFSQESLERGDPA